MSVCLSVLKDLANCWTDRILFYNEDSLRSWKCLYTFWGRLPPPSKRKLHLDFFCLFLKIKNGWGVESSSLSQVPLEASSGIATSSEDNLDVDNPYIYYKQSVNVDFEKKKLWFSGLMWYSEDSKCILFFKFLFEIGNY